MLDGCPIPWSVAVLGGDLFGSDLPRYRSSSAVTSGSASRTIKVTRCPRTNSSSRKPSTRWRARVSSSRRAPKPRRCWDCARRSRPARHDERGTTMTTERVISSDSHVNVRHDQVKEHLATKFHDDYDAALHGVRPRRLRRQRGQGEPGRRRDPARLVGPARATSTRTRGCVDMDTDGVDIEVLYCEVQRVPLPLPAEERRAGERRARSTTRCTTSRRPTRAG